MEQIIKQKNKLFYIAYFLYVVATVMQSTMFTEYAFLSKGFVLMRYAAFVFGAAKIMLDLLQQWNRDRKIKIERNIHEIFCLKTVRQICLYGIISIILLIVSLKTDDRSLIFVFVIILAAKNILTDVIVERTLVLQIVLMAIILISSSVGIIPDLLFKRDMIPIRHALGYTYPSVMVTFCFFILLLYMWNKNESISWKEFLIIETMNFFIYKLTDSKTGFLMIAFVTFIIWIVGINIVRTQIVKLNKYNSKRIVGILYDFFPIWLSIILLLLCLTLQWEGTQLINKFLTNRLQLIVNAVQNYGIHMFGSQIAWVGFGGVTNTDEILASYNFVDSSYGYIIINYGWIVFALAMIAVVWCGRRIRKRESGIRQFLFLMVLLYCFIEPKLLELHVNTFLIIVSPLLTGSLRIEKGKNSK
ncbi:MAG: hypothetical protein ACLU6W_04855 [Lachnospiraceae bacterium]